MSKHLQLATLVVVGLLVPASAFAEGNAPLSTPPPKVVKKSATQHAVLNRSVDKHGDERESFLSKLVLTRWADTVGDYETSRRYQAGSKIPPRATLHAMVERDHDVLGDDQQRVLAGLTLTRRHAQLARFRDLKDDFDIELVKYERDLIRYGRPLPLQPLQPAPEVMIGREERDHLGVERSEGKQDRAHLDAAERGDDRAADREERDWTERGGGRRSFGEPPGSILDEDPEIERDLERDEAREEGREDAELERAEESEERADELDSERELDREEEQGLQQEEDGGVTE